MDQTEIVKICLSCMKKSDDEGTCPYCGRDKAGKLSWSKALAPGTILNNKILIGDILGKGGYGITYIGYDMLLEYPVAVKEFFPDEMVDRSEDERTVVVLDEVNGEEFQKEIDNYLREARVLAEFSKFPGIVAIKDLFYQNGTGYLIMEYLNNGNLRKYVDDKGGWLPVDETLKLMEPVISILGKLHKSDLIHRDISPDNIMMDEDGSVKLIDFGGSKKLGLNNSQVFLGKWGFAPLEQMLSKISEQGPWTDIYGICATLYCIITGDVPQASYERNEKDELLDISQYTITIDKPIANAIMKGLSMDAKDRQQTIDELYKDLYGYLPDEKGKTKETTTAPAKILKDQNGRIWFGEYPMNEVTGAELTSDIEYADYNEEGIAIIAGEKYLRKPIYKQVQMPENSLPSVFKSKLEPELLSYKYFKFNMISWKVVGTKKNRLTLQSEYILDYKLFDLDRYGKMNDKEIAKIKTGVFWEKSKIREWLNSCFVKMAFSSDDRAKLLVTEINTPVSSLSDRKTYDKVYLPSIEEIRYGFDTDISLLRGKQVSPASRENAPYTQYVAINSSGSWVNGSYGLRSRGVIDYDDSYKTSESFEGHALINGKLGLWKLNKGMGIRPVICIDSDNVSELN